MVAPNSFLFFVLFFLCMQICFYEMYVLCATCTGNDTSIQTTLPPNTNATSPWSVDSRTEVQTEKTMTSTFSSQYENGMTSHTSKTVSITTAPVSFSHTVGVSVLANTANSNISLSEGTPTPSQTPDSGLTLLAFGVMSLILILIVVMVVLVTAINLRGRCRDTIQHEGIKSCDSVVSDSNMTSNCEKESITLVSVRTINTENNTDSPQMSSVHSTILDNEDQEFTRGPLGINDGL
ncbi:endothelial cell-specific chemotaxis regulator-like isoform X4 [Sinocyclocheilus rhinocerous]|uniref:endothelial cell-specific chemotaxis regulator-like isoform X4 n=1 Tax=Sinocyclocheilus rhinocerous TaxID=307959 RepID=UPI0007BA7688|nr:PREDICTED: endothelial cell-specific chemotaxis regulator-like isoform X4 [Sinocyclocheilus rhinocerous]